MASACGGGNGSAFDIGIKRVALALAFKEEKLAKPVKPEVIIRVIPAPPGVTSPGDLNQYRTPQTPPISIPPLFPTCAVAPKGAAPADVVRFAVDAPPTSGTYLRHNTGTIVVSGGAFPITLPFPFITTWDLPPAEKVTEPAPAGVGEPTVYTEFEVHKVLAPGFKTIDRFRLLPDKIQLVRRTSINQERTTLFQPSPPVDFYVFGTEGTSWNSPGVDLENGTAMLFQGKIAKREVVDVCGEVYDTYRVEATERVVDLATGATTGTKDGELDVYNVATQLGGLVVRETLHQQAATTDPATGSPLVIEFDYVSTLDTVTPRPLGQ
jgi:hypothetical protein